MKSTFPSPWAHTLGCYISFSLFLLLAVGFTRGDWMYFSPLALIFVAIPTLDAVVGRNLANFEAADFSPLQRGLMTVAPPIFIAFYSLFLIVGCLLFPTLSLVERIGATVSIGVIGSIAIACGHEMFHKTSLLEQVVGRVPLILTAYPQFPQTHIHGHHVHACTDRDSSTSRRGEGLYRFLGRTLAGNYALAWRLTWSAHPKHILETGFAVTACLVASLALVVVAGFSLGWITLIYLAGHALVAIFISETINYMGHYGLLRSAPPPGAKNKNAGPVAWNVYYTFSSYLTFLAQRHSDHHRFARRPYYLLKTDPEGPEMPFGYPVMIGMAMIPPIWHRVMDRRLPIH